MDIAIEPGMEEQEREARGVTLLLDKALRSHVRFPMLEVIYERFVRTASASLRNFTSDNVDVDVKQIISKRFGEYIPSIPGAMLTIMKAVEWSNFGLIVFHNGAIYSFADVLFGGRKIQQGLKVENRIFTSIEQGIVKGLSDLMLNDLSAAFDPLTAISFQRDRIETNPRFAMVARPEDIVIILELNVTMETRVARIDLVFPYATLEPIKKLLLKSFLESATGQDPQWNRHFEDELKLTAVDLNVVIHSHPMEIEDLKQLEVGSTIVLDVLANEPIGAEINDMKVAEGKLGRAGDSMAFKLTTPIDAVAFKF